MSRAIGSRQGGGFGPMFFRSRAFGVTGLAAAALAAAALCSCTSDKPRAGTAPLDPRDAAIPHLNPALEGTIGQYAALADSTPLIVDGIGIVAELPHTGSGDMPPSVRALLLDQLNVSMGAGLASNNTQNIDAEAILASDQVAAVELRGIIPPLARRGDSFDVVVSALPNSQATSIANGLLWTADLKPAVTDLQGNTVAVARGAVFIPGAINRLAGKTPKDAVAARKVLRSGIVLGGGHVTEDRPVRLQLYSPSGRIAQAIERLINGRFPAVVPVASADSDSIVTLTIPEEYASAPADFLEAIRHMYLQQGIPGFAERQAAVIIKALADPSAPHRDLSLALEGLGRSILPDYIEPQYTNANPLVRFWCARAGAAMRDVGGLVVLQEFARNDGPFHDQAATALAEVSRGGDTMRATITLSALLSSPKPSERIAAYQGLLQIHSPAVRQYSVGRGKFFIDVVPSDAPPIIYATQVGTPRIALIGRPITLPASALYVSPDNALSVSAMPPSNPSAQAPAADGTVLTAAALGGNAPEAAPAGKAQNVVLYYRSPLGNRTADLRTSDEIPVIIARLGWSPDPRSPTYDPHAQFIGVSYQRIVEMLASMCNDHTIDAQFALQKAAEIVPTTTEIMRDSRPETSTAKPAAVPAARKAPPPALPELAPPMPVEPTAPPTLSTTP